MEAEYYNVIGVMSGTSLDGIDLAHIQFKCEGKKWSFEIFESDTIAYEEQWVDKLKTAINLPIDDLDILNHSYTQLLATTISNFIQKYDIKNIDAVCSHGHTIFHQPDRGFTLQIGNLPEIALLLNQTVVCDFRVQDVQLGGQGAPLVPMGDQILFSEYDYCMNLGGFSNVSFEENGLRKAFDISPVNTVLNFYANKLGLPYDNKGEKSSSGTLNEALLTELNSLHYYKEQHPKSLGFEFVQELILPIIEQYKISVLEKLRTFTEHAAIQVADALPTKRGTLLITGGGAYNDFLIERIQSYLPEMEIIIPSIKILEFKEALIFALLGVLRLRGEINVLGSVTGASKDHSTGNIFNLK